MKIPNLDRRRDVPEQVYGGAWLMAVCCPDQDFFWWTRDQGDWQTDDGRYIITCLRLMGCYEGEYK